MRDNKRDFSLFTELDFHYYIHYWTFSIQVVYTYVYVLNYNCV